MCNIAVFDFLLKKLDPEEFTGKLVLEVSSKYVNGRLGPFIERNL